MKIHFFTALAAAEILNDKDSIKFEIERTGPEYTVMVVPKSSSKKAILTFSGTPEELDNGIMTEIMRTSIRIKGMISNADTVEIIEEESEKAPIKTIKKPEPKKEIKKEVEVKAEPIIDEEALKRQNFNQCMLDGDQFYADKKYVEAEAEYLKAITIFPDNTKGKAAYEKTFKYINALIRIKLLEPRENWTKKEVENGTEN